MGSHPSLLGFEYQPLNIDTSFRLLRLKGGEGEEIKCEILHSDIFDGKIEYEAVSYTWGDELDADKVLIHNGQLGMTSHLSITLNLSLILRDLRHTSCNEDRILWIDSLCIDQGNLTERSSQVQRMGDIFHRSSRVLFCVGRPNEMTDIFFQALSELDSCFQDDDPSPSTETICQQWMDLQDQLKQHHFGLIPRIQRALPLIFDQPWFYRIWILQEVINAGSALVYYGRTCVSSKIFAFIPEILKHPVKPHVQRVLNLMPSSKRSVARGIQPLSLLVRDFAAAEATDKRDKVFALLDLCSDPESKSSLCPDYEKSEETLVRDLVGYFCGCSTKNIDLEWKTIDGFLSYYVEKHDWLYNEIVGLLSKADDCAPLELMVKKHASTFRFDIQLIKWVARNPSRTFMAWFLSHAAFQTVIAEAQGDSRLTAIQDAVLWACFNKHEDFLCRMLHLGLIKDEEMELCREVPHMRYYGRESIRYAGWMVLGRGALTPLVLASAHGLELWARQLLDKGFEKANRVDSRSTAPFEQYQTFAEHFRHFEQRPILVAAAFGNDVLLKMLLDAGFDDAIQTPARKGALYYAVRNGHKHIVEMLLKRGHSVHVKHFYLDEKYPDDPEDIRNDFTLAHAAAALDDPAVLKLLIDAGADPEALANDNRISPLMVAVSHGSLAVITFLLDSKVHINGLESLIALDRLCKTPFTGPPGEMRRRETMHRQSIIFQRLLDHEMPMGSIDETVPSAMVTAALLPLKALETLSMMFEAGVKFDTAEGRFALFMTEIWGDPEVGSVLRRYGALDATDAERVVFSHREIAQRYVWRYFTSPGGCRAASIKWLLQAIAAGRPDRLDMMHMRLSFDERHKRRSQEEWNRWFGSGVDFY